MNTPKHDSPVPLESDAELVRLARLGRRDAFGRIVARYQSLICALTFSCVGRAAPSEDLAQEVFLAAWQNLGRLDDPSKLRAWLCGIARNVINDSLRRRRRQPTAGAEPMEAMRDLADPGPDPSMVASQAEREEILRRALEALPEGYRVPLVLFYREEQSVDAVAAALELSADAARQRISRARRLLQAQMAGLVEEMLRETAPTSVFTACVLAALPAAAFAPAAAAPAAKAGLIKWAAWLGDPLIAAAVSLAAGIQSLRAGREYLLMVGPERRARARKHQVAVGAGAAAAFVALVAILCWAGAVDEWNHGSAICLLLNAWLAATAAGLGWLWRRFRAEGGRRPAEADSPIPLVVAEYRSSVRLLGLPLVHRVRHRSFGSKSEREAPVAAWIAIGPASAYGVLFACGKTAVGLVAVGKKSLGILSLGLFSAGLVSVGGVSLAVWAVGWLALADKSCGVVALGLSGAEGVAAWAGHFARDLAVTAAGEPADSGRFFQGDFFFRTLNFVVFHSSLIPAAGAVLIAFLTFSSRPRRVGKTP